MARRLGLILAVLVALTVACGIPSRGEVTRIPDNQVGVLDDTVPTTSTTTTTTTTPETTIEPTTTTVAESTTSTIATEEVNLYFISGGILRALPWPLTKGASSFEVLRALQEGPPSGDIGGALRTAVPTAVHAPLTITEDGSGVATVDLPADFFDIVQPEDQRWAIGQIVLTLTDIGGIGQVLFTQAGGPVGVPRGAGDFVQPGQPVPPKDYFELLEAPVPTTTTTVATSSTSVG